MRLFLCEKPSQGNDIADVIGANKRAAGCRIGEGVTVTWAIGHLLEAAQPDRYDETYKQWAIRDLPILPEQWMVDVVPKTAEQFKVVKKLLSSASEVIVATDADREGEMIGWELLEYCGYRGPVKRLWLSAQNEISVRKGLAQLKSGQETYPLYQSALARSRADWLIGINLSRLFTLLGRDAGYDGVLSVGRVQTPTLKLVVDREREIKSFVPKPFWQLDVALRAGQHPFAARWMPPEAVTDDAGRCIDHARAQRAADAISATGQAHVDSIETEGVKEGPPLPFDLTALQKLCDRLYGMGAQETLDVGQALYEKHKLTSYPRTDCCHLPESMYREVPAVMKALADTDPSIAPLIAQLDPQQRSRAWNDAKVDSGSHFGIIPVAKHGDLAALPEKERWVYDLIRRRYLAQFAPHHEYDRTVVWLSSAGERLRTTGKRIRVPGWKDIVAIKGSDDSAQAEEGAQALPPLQQGTVVPIADVDLKALKTKPPAPYTESTLLDAMKQVAKFVTDPRLRAKLKETSGIGTSATQGSIIKGLIDRGYLVKNKRALSATEAAYTVIDAVPPAIADPGTTAIWEQALDMISKGQMTLDDFVVRQSKWVGGLVERYRSTTLNIKVPPPPACPKCQAPMRKRMGKSGPFWSCSRYPDCDGIQSIGTKKPAKRKGGSRKPSPRQQAHG